MRTSSGFGISCGGDLDDPAHVEVCLLCQKVAHRERRKERHRCPACGGAGADWLNLPPSVSGRERLLKSQRCPSCDGTGEDSHPPTEQNGD